MMSLSTRHARAPAEVFRASQGCHHLNFAQSARTAVLTASTWNVYSMVDTEGPIEVTSQWCDDRRGEDRKILFSLERHEELHNEQLERQGTHGSRKKQ